MDVLFMDMVLRAADDAEQYKQHTGSWPDYAIMNRGTFKYLERYLTSLRTLERPDKEAKLFLGMKVALCDYLDKGIVEVRKEVEK